jgi:hypothetical protein
VGAHTDTVHRTAKDWGQDRSGTATDQTAGCSCKILALDNWLVAQFYFFHATV